MDTDGAAPRRRPQWLGERKAVLVRLPVDVAERLAEAAAEHQATVSGLAVELISQGLAGPDRGPS